VATDLLASIDARKLAVIGTGAAAPDQIRAVCAVRNIQEIAIAGRDAAKTRTHAAKMEIEFPRITIAACEAPAEAVSDADVICTATTSRVALFELTNVKPTVHINAIGAFSPAMRELSAELVAAARRLCVDDLAALADCGDLVEPLARGRITREQIEVLGDVLARNRHIVCGGISVFKSIGIAPQDWAIAARLASAAG
jgi:ornithine cyclodeaminase